MTDHCHPYTLSSEAAKHAQLLTDQKNELSASISVSGTSFPYVQLMPLPRTVNHLCF